MVEKENADWGKIYSPPSETRFAFGISTRVYASPTRVGGKLVNFNNEAYVLIRSFGFNPTDDDGYGAASSIAVTLIHELLHVAAKVGTYPHDDENYQDAAKALGAKSVNDYINKYCKVKQK